jgi:CRP/FNR family transcriptional regulator, cyclic AMP receptor protein
MSHSELALSPLQTLRGEENALVRVLANPDFPTARWRVLTFKAGELILREGDSSGHIYVVQSGSVRVEGTVTLQSGRQFQAGVTQVGAGGVFGELALFDRQPHSASVFANGDTTVAAIEGAALLEFLEQHRELGYEVFKDFLAQLAPRLRATSARVYRFLAWGLKAYHLDQ